MATIAQRELALGFKTTLPPPTGLAQVDPTQKSEYQGYLSTRRGLMAKYNAALFATDGKDEAWKIRGQIEALDALEKKPVIVLPEVQIVSMNIGRPAEAQGHCVAAAQTRHTPGSFRQAYGNCGLEAWRAFVNAERAKLLLPPVSEDAFMQRAQQLGLAGKDPEKPWAIGATSAAGRVQLLSEYGVQAKWDSATLPNIEQAVKFNKHLSVSVSPIEYWPKESGARDDFRHEVAVTGLSYDESGNVAGYYVTDSALGECQLLVPKEKFQKALVPGWAITVAK